MSKKVIRLITLVIAIAMIATLAVGCGGDNAASTSSGSSSTDNTTSGGNKNESAPGNAFLENPEDYRGTKVVYVTWKDPWKNEDGDACDAFMAEYGIQMEAQLIGQGDYVQTIAASIASDTQGDIFFENGDFPGSLTVMQPLDAARLNLEDPIWNQALIKASTLEGHPYLVDAISNVWTEVDICVYNKELFAQRNIPTPDQYYAADKWTFENFKWCATEISKLGKGYMGASILGEVALGAAGCASFTFADNQMKVTVDDKYRKVFNYLAQMNADGVMKLDRSSFGNGKDGMALTNCFGLKKTGYYTKINPDHLGATFIPKWDENSTHTVTGIYRGWGLIDGAKNPVGAGFFLREYLDVNNYKLDKTFHNTEVANFFFQVTGQYSDAMIYYHGPDMVKTTGMGVRFDEQWAYQTPANTNSYIDSQLNLMQTMCDRANEIIDKERAWIKQTYK